MIEEPVPTMPLMVPARSPTVRTKRKPKTYCLRDSFRPERKATNFRNAPATQLRSVWRVTSPAIERAADTMLAAGSGYETHLKDHSEGTDRANQGKLPLRPDAIRSQRGAGRR